MAITNSAAIGKGRGSIGNVTLTTDAIGRTIARQKPQEVTNPKSDSQVAQRNNFSIITSFMSAILAILNTYWIRSRPNVAQYSEAVGKALKKVGKSALQLDQIAQTRLQIAKGNLQTFGVFTFLTNSFDTNNKQWSLDMDWDSSIFGNGNQNDTVQFVLVNMSKNQQEGASTVSTRSVGNKNFLFTLSYPTDIYVILYVTKNAAGTLVGDGYTLAFYDGDGGVYLTA